MAESSCNEFSPHSLDLSHLAGLLTSPLLTGLTKAGNHSGYKCVPAV